MIDEIRKARRRCARCRRRLVRAAEPAAHEGAAARGASGAGRRKANEGGRRAGARDRGLKNGSAREQVDAAVAERKSIWSLVDAVRPPTDTAAARSSQLDERCPACCSRCASKHGSWALPNGASCGCASIPTTSPCTRTKKSSRGTRPMRASSTGSSERSPHRLRIADERERTRKRRVAIVGQQLWRHEGLVDRRGDRSGAGSRRKAAKTFRSCSSACKSRASSPIRN